MLKTTDKGASKKGFKKSNLERELKGKKRKAEKEKNKTKIISYISKP